VTTEKKGKGLQQLQVRKWALTISLGWWQRNLWRTTLRLLSITCEYWREGRFWLGNWEEGKNNSSTYLNFSHLEEKIERLCKPDRDCNPGQKHYLKVGLIRQIEWGRRRGTQTYEYVGRTKVSLNIFKDKNVAKSQIFAFFVKNMMPDAHQKMGKKRAIEQA
jgi:hypothetical protein